MKNTWLENLVYPLILIGLSIVLTAKLGFNHPLGGVLIASTLYFLAQLIRKNKLFEFLGIRQVHSPGNLASSKQDRISFIMRKSMWILIPLIYLILSPEGTLKDLGLIISLTGKAQIYILAILAVLTVLLFSSAKNSGTSPTNYLHALITAFLAAGFPEDFMILGLIGGRVFKLCLLFLPPLAAKICTIVLVESLFCLSHIPLVKKNHAFYSEHMTAKPSMSYPRMFIQMFIFALPGWIFYFLSSHIYFSVWWHSLGDIAAFLPPEEDKN